MLSRRFSKFVHTALVGLLVFQLVLFPVAPIVTAQDTTGEETEAVITDNTNEAASTESPDSSSPTDLPDSSGDSSSESSADNTGENTDQSSQASASGQGSDQDTVTQEAASSGPVSPAEDESASTSVEGNDSVQASVTVGGEDDETLTEAGSDTSLVIQQENEAEVSTTVEGAAVSGFNDSSSGGSGVEIGTGNVEVEGEVLETVNTNVNSEDGCLEYVSVEDQEGDLVVTGCSGGFTEGEQTTPSAEINEHLEETDVSDESHPADSSDNPNSADSQDSQDETSEESSETGTSASSEQTTEIDNTNQAEVTTEVVIEAVTGGNQANANQGDVSIETGDASVWVSFVQFINTTITADNAFLAIVNIFGELVGDIVFPEGFSSQVLSDKESLLKFLGSSSAEQLEVLRVENTNDLDLQEQVSLTADTGSNQAGGNECDVVVSTGDADVKASLVNVANTNIVADNWGGVIVNDFGNWEGELRSEGALCPVIGCGQDEGEGGGSSSYTASTINKANSSHQVNLSAISGINRASDNQGDVSIKTGDASVRFSFVSFINTTINARRSIFSVINIFGRMVGDIVFGGPGSGEAEPFGGDSQDASDFADSSSEEVVEVTNTNTATVNKNIDVLAHTGGNIIGDPDLVLKKSHNVDNGVVIPGEDFAYYLSVSNIGLSEAYDVVIEDTLPEKFVYQYDTSGVSPQVSGQTYRWNVGTVWPGQTIEFWVYGQVISDVAEGQYSLHNEASVETSTREENKDNNVGGVDLTLAADAVLYISKGHNRGNGVYAGDQITYWVKVENQGTGYTVDRGILDTLPEGFVYLTGSTIRDGGNWSDPSGNNPYYWSFDALHPGEAVTFTYTVKVGDNVLPGVYNNSVAVLGGPSGSQASSDVKVSVGVQVLGGTVLASAQEPEGQVLGLPATGSQSYLAALVGLLLIATGLNLRFLYFRRNTAVKNYR